MPLGWTGVGRLPSLSSAKRIVYARPREARSCETLQRSNECECPEGLCLEVRTNEAEDGPSWYLPHFPVIREDRETTKVWVVFDLAACCKGASLNGVMLARPKLQQDVYFFDLD